MCWVFKQRRVLFENRLTNGEGHALLCAYPRWRTRGRTP
jgi:hypothetical protein